jgi:geranylgeranyl diphosphate synthase type II
LTALLGDFFDREKARAAAYGPHFARLWTLAGRAVSGGKLVRPRLLIDSYEALISDDAWSADGVAAVTHDEVARLAVAVELLHYSFLLHDDVIDGDLLRRGRPNLIGAMLDDNRAPLGDMSRAMHWAQTCGILMGDLLLSASHQIFARAEVPDVQRRRLLDLLDSTILDSVAGEQIDVGLSDAIIPPDLATILDMTTRKTATYTFELPMRMAAVLAGASGGVKDLLGAIGRHLGLAFQLQDDLMSVFGGRPTPTCARANRRPSSPPPERRRGGPVSRTCSGWRSSRPPRPPSCPLCLSNAGRGLASSTSPSRSCVRQVR